MNGTSREVCQKCRIVATFQVTWCDPLCRMPCSCQDIFTFSLHIKGILFTCSHHKCTYHMWCVVPTVANLWLSLFGRDCCISFESSFRLVVWTRNHWQKSCFFTLEQIDLNELISSTKTQRYSVTDTDWSPIYFGKPNDLKQALIIPLWKGIQEVIGFQIPGRGFRIPYLGFRIPRIGSKWIPDSKLNIDSRVPSIITITTK